MIQVCLPSGRMVQCSKQFDRLEESPLKLMMSATNTLIAKIAARSLPILDT